MRFVIKLFEGICRRDFRQGNGDILNHVLLGDMSMIALLLPVMGVFSFSSSTFQKFLPAFSRRLSSPVSIIREGCACFTRLEAEIVLNQSDDAPTIINAQHMPIGFLYLRNGA